MRYTDSCHCGNVAFHVEGEIGAALACNCSNVRCLEGIDLGTVKVHHYDGRSK